MLVNCGARYGRFSVISALLVAAVAFASCLPASRVEASGVSVADCGRLVSGLKSKDISERRSAALAAQEAGVHVCAPDLVPALIETLGDPDVELRTHAAAALSIVVLSAEQVGQEVPSAKAAVPVLLRLLSDDNTRVREYAAQAVALIGSATPDAIHAATAALRDKSDRVREMGVTFLDSSPGASPEICSALAERLREDSSETVRVLAARALRKCGGEESTLRVLVKGLKDPSASVRSQVAATLAGLESEGMAKHWNVLQGIAAQKTEDPLVRLEVISAFARKKELTPNEVRLLLPIAKDETEEESVRTAAISALGRSGKLAAEVAPTLLACLNGPSPMLAQAAALALGELGDARAPLVQSLVEASNRANIGAIRALGKLGAKDREVILPTLIEKLQSSDERIRVAAVGAITQMGAAGSGATAALAETAANDNSEAVRRLATEALKRLKGGSGEVR